MLFFEAAPGRARTIEKFFFAGFAFFTFKLNYCRVTGPQNKIFNKNKLTLVIKSRGSVLFQNSILQIISAEFKILIVY
jgi:hypothetical protein